MCVCRCVRPVLAININIDTKYTLNYTVIDCTKTSLLLAELFIAFLLNVETIRIGQSVHITECRTGALLLSKRSLNCLIAFDSIRFGVLDFETHRIDEEKAI